MDDSREQQDTVRPWRVIDGLHSVIVGLISIGLLFSSLWYVGLFGVIFIGGWEYSFYRKRKQLEDMKPRAEEGDAEAQFLVGNIYAEDHTLNRDYDQAFNWYRKSAEQGYAKALDRVSAWYSRGYGTPKDDAEALFWLYLAKKAGVASTYLDPRRVEAQLTPEQIAIAAKRAAEWKPTSLQSVTTDATEKRSDK